MTALILIGIAALAFTIGLIFSTAARAMTSNDSYETSVLVTGDARQWFDTHLRLGNIKRVCYAIALATLFVVIVTS